MDNNCSNTVLMGRMLLEILRVWVQ